MPGSWLLAHRRAAWCTVVALLAVLAGCWIWVRVAGAMPGERALFPWVAYGRPPLVPYVVVKLYSLLGIPPIAVVVVAVVAWVVERREGVVMAALALAAAAVPVLTTALKAVIGTAPLQRLAEGDEPAFPSGHTAFAASLFGFVCWLALARGRRDVAAGALVIVVGMGPARIIQGVHWPSDVIGGYAIGFAWLLAVLLIGLPWARTHGAAQRR